MKHWFAIFALAASPVYAEDVEPAQPNENQTEIDEGITLLEEGAKLFLRGLMNEVEPALRDMQQEMEPVLRSLLEKLDDLDAYHLPEVLPNGDIILRRKVPLEPKPQDDEVDI